MKIKLTDLCKMIEDYGFEKFLIEVKRIYSKECMEYHGLCFAVSITVDRLFGKGEIVEVMSKGIWVGPESYIAAIIPLFNVRTAWRYLDTFNLSSYRSYMSSGYWWDPCNVISRLDFLDFLIKYYKGL